MLFIIEAVFGPINKEEALIVALATTLGVILLSGILFIKSLLNIGGNNPCACGTLRLSCN
jgi:hypothetical protein